MKEYLIRVTQDYRGYYIGDIVIEARNEKSALNKLRKMSQKKLNDMVQDWEQADDTSEDGPIEIDKDSIHEL